MNIIEQMLKQSYYSEYSSENLLLEIQKKITPSVTSLNNEFQYIFYKLLHTDPCSYWDHEVYVQTESLLERLYQTCASRLVANESVIEFFLMGYSTYCQLSDTIGDLQNFNLASEIKNRLYRLPTYTSIIEGCLSNFFRVIATLTGQGIGKDYSVQNTLKQLLDVVITNGYGKIANGINVNIRNAINHGKVSFRKDPSEIICFYYTEQHIPKCIELRIFEFDHQIEKAYDTAGAVLLALATFFNNHLSLLKYRPSERSYVSFSLLSMQLSIPGIFCSSISDVENSKQINTDLEISNTDFSYIAQTALKLSILVFDKYNTYDFYLFSFSNPRMQTGWIRFQKQDILDLLTLKKHPTEIINTLIHRNEVLIFSPSTEAIDLNEVKYFCFPNHTDCNYKINNVHDASTSDRKRLRANLFIGDLSNRNDILEATKKAIEWMLTLKNPPSPTLPQKHGTIPADSVYLNVYRFDGRKSKEISANNTNFICFLDYNRDGNTTLAHGGLRPIIWSSLHHETDGNTRIAWRTSEFFTRKVVHIGRNEPCPCGSGLKYKKCCGKQS